MKVHFITFADGMNMKYVNAAISLKKMAEDYDIFSSVRVYSYEDLKQDSDFIAKHENFILQNRRGFGYWIWKPYIIWKTLCEVDDGDIVLYLDSCCSLHLEGKCRFMEYIEMVKRNPCKMLVSYNPGQIGDWTKMDTLVNLDALTLKDNSIIMGGMQFTMKTPQTVLFYKYWYDIMSSDYHLIDDSPSNNSNLPSFTEHRHDQSIFSILVYKLVPSAARYLIEEVYYHGKTPDKSFPIHIHSNGYDIWY